VHFAVPVPWLPDHESTAVVLAGDALPLGGIGELHQQVRAGDLTPQRRNRHVQRTSVGVSFLCATCRRYSARRQSSSSKCTSRPASRSARTIHSGMPPHPTPPSRRARLEARSPTRQTLALTTPESRRSPADAASWRPVLRDRQGRAGVRSRHRDKVDSPQVLAEGCARYSGPVTRLGRLVSSAAGIDLAGNVERSFRPKSSAARGGKALRGKPRWRCHGHLTLTVTRIQG
jgi:hypothetical protein